MEETTVTGNLCEVWGETGVALYWLEHVKQVITTVTFRQNVKMRK